MDLNLRDIRAFVTVAHTFISESDGGVAG